jgi:hypothetical protein
MMNDDEAEFVDDDFEDDDDDDNDKSSSVLVVAEVVIDAVVLVPRPNAGKRDVKGIVGNQQRTCRVVGVKIVV